MKERGLGRTVSAEKRVNLPPHPANNNLNSGPAQVVTVLTGNRRPSNERLSKDQKPRPRGAGSKKTEESECESSKK
jgi:hypothetical protein